jgi:hypothetical protein
MPNKQARAKSDGVKGVSAATRRLQAPAKQDLSRLDWAFSPVAAKRAFALFGGKGGERKRAMRGEGSSFSDCCFIAERQVID